MPKQSQADQNNFVFWSPHARGWGKVLKSAEDVITAVKIRWQLLEPLVSLDFSALDLNYLARNGECIPVRSLLKPSPLARIDILKIDDIFAGHIFLSNARRYR
jgi:hypothetical protein